MCFRSCIAIVATKSQGQCRYRRCPAPGVLHKIKGKFDPVGQLELGVTLQAFNLNWAERALYAEQVTFAFLVMPVGKAGFFFRRQCRCFARARAGPIRRQLRLVKMGYPAFLLSFQ